MDITADFLEPGYFYHIYNRGINGEPIFSSDDNRYFFLNKIKQHLLPIAEVYAYCLMPNHFHMVLKIRERPIFDNSAKVLNFGKVAPNTGLHAEQSTASKQIAKFISSYTQAYNKQHQRHGGLLERPFKRKRIKTEDYLRSVIIYVHRNVLQLDARMETTNFHLTCVLFLKIRRCCRELKLLIFLII
ncbi:MAG: hypothetical protein EAS48_08980 [Chryseobacterium sp.]|nr:MAG: hypothetical protein EAS48_08980 [Chryseobacterium sp.]